MADVAEPRPSHGAVGTYPRTPIQYHVASFLNASRMVTSRGFYCPNLNSVACGLDMELYGNDLALRFAKTNTVRRPLKPDASADNHLGHCTGLVENHDVDASGLRNVERNNLEKASAAVILLQ
jgi:hypothetical protein